MYTHRCACGETITLGPDGTKICGCGKAYTYQLLRDLGGTKFQFTISPEKNRAAVG